MARILKWFAIPFSSGPPSVRPLHHDPPILGGPTGYGLVSFSFGPLASAGGPRGATPCSRSGGLAVRRYSSSKVGSCGCALLEQPWRDTQVQGKRNPCKMVGVARGQQRVDTLKPYSQKTSQSNHTSTIAFSNSLGPMDILILIIPIHQSINMECLFTCPCLV